MIIGRDPLAAGDWLEQELAHAALAMPFGVVEQLAAMGVPRGVLAELCSVGDLGRMRVVEERGAHGLRWRPVEEGEPPLDMQPPGTRIAPRLILAVRDGAGRLLDLAAISSVDPDLWSLRTGMGVMLGEDVIDDVLMAEPAGKHDPAAEVRLFSRPIDFLCSGGAYGQWGGICVLDWRPAALWALRSLGPDVTLVADDAAAAANLARLLQCGALPQVKWDRGRRMAA